MKYSFSFEDDNFSNTVFDTVVEALEYAKGYLPDKACDFVYICECHEINLDDFIPSATYLIETMEDDVLDTLSWTDCSDRYNHGDIIDVKEDEVKELDADLRALVSDWLRKHVSTEYLPYEVKNVEEYNLETGEKVPMK